MTPHLEPARDQLEIFVDALFRHAGAEGWVSFRSFFEGNSSKPFRLSPTSLAGGFKFLVDVAEDDARRAANDPKPVVFCPPLAVFNGRDRAREQDIAQGLVLSAECDQRPQDARARLKQILGPATLVVSSGGTWIDPATGEIQPKLHLHWRLRKPAQDPGALAKLKRARDLAAALVGGDPSNKPVCHPIRWPGSWHRKNDPVLCCIEAQNPDIEIDLDTALAALEAATPADKTNGAGSRPPTSSEDWAPLIQRVLTAESFHQPLTVLAMKMLVAGMDDRAATNMIRGLMQNTTGEHDPQRWQDRYDNDIPHAVSTARAKIVAQAQGATQPSEPVDLWAKFLPPLLPRGLLPDVIERFAFDQGASMGGDPAGLAMSALTVCAAAIPDRIELQVKRHDPMWKEAARIWTALIGSPSTKKTPILTQAVRPLARIDHDLWRTYINARAKYDNLSAEERKLAPAPKQLRARIEDTTIEGAQKVFRDSVDGLLCVQDELSGWFGTMDKYSGHRGSAKDRGFWLQAWNGGPYALNRINRGPSLIENLSVCVLGGIQPDLIRKVAAETVDDGFLQRLLPIVLVAGRGGKDEEMLSAAVAYGDLVRHLHILARPQLLHFDDGAQTLRQQLEQKHLDLTALETINKKLAAHIGKYDGMFARLCVIWHCIEHVDERLPTEVTEETAQRVARFMHEFLLPHALAFYAGVLNLADDHDRLAAVAGYILARKLDRITNRDVQRGDRTMRRLTRRDTELVFEQLEALGWVARTPPTRLTDPPHWRVNEHCHQLFENRAKEEAERRHCEQVTLVGVFKKGA
jgi:hypothetical protein